MVADERTDERGALLKTTKMKTEQQLLLLVNNMIHLSSKNAKPLLVQAYCK